MAAQCADPWLPRPVSASARSDRSSAASPSRCGAFTRRPGLLSDHPPLPEGH